MAADLRTKVDLVIGPRSEGSGAEHRARPDLVSIAKTSLPIFTDLFAGRSSVDKTRQRQAASERGEVAGAAALCALPHRCHAEVQS